jgi:hypothetical protein
MPLHFPQNGKAECILRTLNNTGHTILLQSHAPSSFWTEALNTATHVLNCRPCRATCSLTPFELLFGSPLAYNHLRVFGCLCFPNMTTTLTHLGYPVDHKGYRCFNLATRKVITSGHVVFDETQSPFVVVPVSSLELASPCSAPLPLPRHTPDDDDAAP